MKASIKTAKPNPMLITAIRLIAEEKLPLELPEIRLDMKNDKFIEVCKVGFSKLEEQTNLSNNEEVCFLSICDMHILWKRIFTFS